MRLKLKTSSLLLLALWSAGCFGQAFSKSIDGAKSDPKASRQCFFVRQQTSALGPVELYLADDAGCLVTHKGDVKIVCRPPTYEIVCYSESKREYYKIANAPAFKDNLDVFCYPVDLSRGQITKDKDAHLNLPLTRVFVDGKKVHGVSNDAFIFRDRSQRVVKDLVYRTADICPLRKEIQIFLYWIYNDNNYSGVPFDARLTYTDGNALDMIKTLSVEKTSRPASLFEYPKDCKPSRTKIEVLISPDAAATMEELWGSVKEKGK